ncbi:MAG: DUF3750 domain-containing protein [Phycisphaerae bacterium]
MILLAGCHVVPDQQGFHHPGSPIDAPIVQLRCAKIPYVESIAAHCWFVGLGPDVPARRWEVWQEPRGNHGHLQIDCRPAFAGVGAGESWVLAEFHGPQAQRLLAILDRPEEYPWRQTYRYWPGPNSNTYVAWVLGKAKIDAPLPPAAIGAGYVIRAD